MREQDKVLLQAIKGHTKESVDKMSEMMISVMAKMSQDYGMDWLLKANGEIVDEARATIDGIVRGERQENATPENAKKFMRAVYIILGTQAFAGQISHKSTAHLDN